MSHSFGFELFEIDLSFVLIPVMVVPVLLHVSPSRTSEHFGGFSRLPFIAWGTLISFTHILFVHYGGILTDREWFLIEGEWRICLEGRQT